ncbi:MAG: 1-acyl-sn-glycerol-3-phosphate acyltransferase, partial [Bacteroidetes bacterium]|nr:1-acyl-sn-glycerol-3-phosphate acyltransferase [Bacteroidota bacterium]
KFDNLLNKEFEILDNKKPNNFRKLFLDDYITEKQNKTSIVTLLKVAPENKPVIYKYFENDENITLLDKQYLISRFVQIINDDFTRIAVMTSLLVFFALLIIYGRIELTLVSFIPMFISWVWILGIMGITGMKFNIINIIISALIFGLGDDYSLFIMDGLLQEYKTGKKNLPSFKSSILLSAITTIAGLGVLIFAKHPALRSIAMISIVGILCVVIMSQILIPFLFTLLIKNRVQKKQFPWTMLGFLKSLIAFSLFISVSIFFTLLGKVFTIINVKEKGKYLYHLLISKACYFLIYVMVNVKKKVINPLNEDLTNPAIIICNHQSSLDIVPLIMLHPKILMFTNTKKWNAPFFGSVIRMAEYFPADQIDQHLEKLADRIKNGYSVVIFPEGTRSEYGDIGRFHKGAFYLAEKLNVDILPIVIHGTNYTLTKKDALLKNGTLNLKYLPRIRPNDYSFGNNYSERAKKIGNYFRQEFEYLKNEIEQISYFREKLIYNFIYKGPVIEWYMRVKTKLENNYQIFHELIPKESKILDIGCGYGFMSYMLHFASHKRIITGIDYDEEKIETANHCFSKSDDINFYHSNVLAFEFELYDTIILADILHYLQPNEQILVLNKCIENLNKSGILIIRDGNIEEKQKHKRTELTEFFSTKVFSFNKVHVEGLSFLSATTIREAASRNKMSFEEIHNSKITSNTIYVLKKID